MSAGSLVVVRGMKFDKKRDYDEQVREIAEISGLKFIKLNYTRPRYSIHGQTVKNFQSVEIRIGQDREGQRTYSYEGSKDRDGKDCSSARNLAFEPKAPTNLLEAELPDTEFNRRRLASCYYYHAMWKIVDPVVDTAVKAIADEFEVELRKERESKPTQADVIVGLADENARLKEELALAKAESAKKKDVEDVVKSAAETSKKAAIEKEIKDQVCLEMKDLIEEIKKTKRQWWISEEYRKKIRPEIQRRLDERLKNAGNNSGVGVDNQK